MSRWGWAEIVNVPGLVAILNGDGRVVNLVPRTQIVATVPCFLHTKPRTGCDLCGHVMSAAGEPSVEKGE